MFKLTCNACVQYSNDKKSFMFGKNIELDGLKIGRSGYGSRKKLGSITAARDKLRTSA